MNVEIKTYHKEMKPSRSFSIFHSQFRLAKSRLTAVARWTPAAAGVSIIFWVLD